ncbi:MAG: HyaD/HybD family hydrogenase maturation endopeptidase [Betaproteobacteria bacterium]
MAKKWRVLVLGVGNILLQDEGFGVRVIQAMEERRVPLPPDVTLLDGGTAGFALMNPIAEAEKVVVVDTVKGGQPPGTLYRFDTRELGVKRMPMDSLHQVDFYQVLEALERLGERPDQVIVIGCEPKVIDVGLELSPEVAAKVDRAIELVLAEL